MVREAEMGNSGDISQKLEIGGRKLNTHEDVERAFSDWREVAEKNGKMSEYQNLRDLISAHSAGHEVDTEKIRQLSEVINTKQNESTAEEVGTLNESNIIPVKFGGRNREPFSQDSKEKPSQESPIAANDNMPGHESTVEESPQEDLIAANDNIPDSSSDSKTESGAEKMSKEEIQKRRDDAKRLLIESTDGGIHKFLALPDVYRVYKLEYFVSLSNLNEYLDRFDDLTDEERSSLPEMVVEFEKAVGMVIDAYEKHHDAETAADDNEIKDEELEEIKAVDEDKEPVKTEVKEIPPYVYRLKEGMSSWDAIKNDLIPLDVELSSLSSDVQDDVINDYLKKLQSDQSMRDLMITRRR